MSAPVYVIQGREVTLPCVVRDASSGSATFPVSAAAARRLLPEAFEPAELWPGRALATLAAIDYRDNDLGDYNEVSIAFFVRRRGEGAWWRTAADLARGRLATFIHWLPVDQGFTREAGFEIWGFPKTVEHIDFAYANDRVTCRLEADGAHVLTLSLPRGGDRTLPESELTTYTEIHGVPHRTRFTSTASGFGLHLRGASLELGPHPYADELRSLGLPRRPLMATWMESMRASFGPPEKLDT